MYIALQLLAFIPAAGTLVDASLGGVGDFLCPVGRGVSLVPLVVVVAVRVIIDSNEILFPGVLNPESFFFTRREGRGEGERGCLGGNTVSGS